MSEIWSGNHTHGRRIWSVWWPVRKGRYQVNTVHLPFNPAGFRQPHFANKLAMVSKHHNCLDDLDKKATKTMRNLAVPSKISIFSWCMFHNLLPTRFNLLMRGINLDAMCKLCGQGVEDDMHIFWSCSCVNSFFQFMLQLFKATTSQKL
ncbi:hypothetical protein V6N13_077134 [Hibiscus sabdariffa]